MRPIGPQAPQRARFIWQGIVISHIAVRNFSATGTATMNVCRWSIAQSNIMRGCFGQPSATRRILRWSTSTSRPAIGGHWRTQPQVSGAASPMLAFRIVAFDLRMLQMIAAIKTSTHRFFVLLCTTHQSMSRVQSMNVCRTCI